MSQPVSSTVTFTSASLFNRDPQSSSEKQQFRRASFQTQINQHVRTETRTHRHSYMRTLIHTRKQRHVSCPAETSPRCVGRLQHQSICMEDRQLYSQTLRSCIIRRFRPSLNSKYLPSHSPGVGYRAPIHPHPLLLKVTNYKIQIRACSPPHSQDIQENIPSPIPAPPQNLHVSH